MPLNTCTNQLTKREVSYSLHLFITPRFQKQLTLV
jgi:hypothetical protein